MEVYAQMPDHPESLPIPPQAGAAVSFQDLFRTHYPQVVRQIMRIIRDPSLSEDLAQEVFLRLHDQDHSAIANIGGWLHQASTHAAYNYLRGEKRRIARDEQPPEMLSVEPSTEERWLQQDEIETVREALTDLGERDRTLLLLKYSGYNYQELSQATQVETASVGTLLARAKRRFRDLYQRKRGD